MNDLSYALYWLWNDVKNIPGNISWRFDEWYLIAFNKATCITEYCVFMQDGSYLYRYSPVVYDGNWLDNAREDKDDHLMRCSEHCSNAVSPK